MKPRLAVLALLALGVAAQAQDRGPGSPQSQARGRMAYANPSAAIAAELAFARLAQEKGQWTAFKATAAPDAVMFTPAMVLAQAWLKDRPNPATGLTWQPHQVWSSCDGSLMVTNGAWQKPGNKHGWFTTVWQRQPKGGYKWVLDHGDETKDPVAAPDMIAARVADCPERRMGPRPSGKPSKQAKPVPIPFDPTRREGRSDDGSLIWTVTSDATGARDFTAQMRIEGQMQDIRKERVAGG